MNWKHGLMIALLPLFTLVLQVGAWAGSAEERPASGEEMNVNDAVEMIRTLYQAEYKDILQSELNLTEEESKAFWPVYNRYHAEMYDTNSWLLGLIEQLAIMEGSESTSKQDSISLIRQFMDMEKKALETRQEYLDDFSAILPHDKLIRFYQLENKATALVRVRLAEAVPLKSLKK